MSLDFTLLVLPVRLPLNECVSLFCVISLISSSTSSPSTFCQWWRGSHHAYCMGYHHNHAFSLPSHVAILIFFDELFISTNPIGLGRGRIRARFSHQIYFFSLPDWGKPDRWSLYNLDRAETFQSGHPSFVITCPRPVSRYTKFTRKAAFLDNWEILVVMWWESLCDTSLHDV